MKSTLVKLAITVVSCWIIYSSIDYREFLSTFAASDLVMALAALVVIFLIRVIMAGRWHIILAALGVRTPFSQVIRVTLVSQSLGYLLPTSVGSDLLRVQQMHARRLTLHRATSSVIVDRVLGTLSLVVVTLLAAMVDLVGENRVEFAGEIAALSLTVIVIGCIGFVVWPAIWRRLSGNPVFQKLPGRLTRFMHRVSEAVTSQTMLRAVGLPIMLLSVLVQVLRAVVVFILFHAVGQDVAFLYCLIFVPMVFVVLMLPITIGGLGLREGTMAYFFSTVGVPAEASVAAGLAFFFLGLIVLVPGFLLFWLMPESSSSVIHEEDVSLPDSDRY